MIYKTITFLIFLSNWSFAQVASCHDASFHQEVARMVDPSTATIDVDTLNKYAGDYIFIDSRTQKEYDVSYISGAVHMHFRAEKDQLASIPKDKKIAVYCSIGKRSDMMTQRLRAIGYDAFNVYGGMFEWVNRGLPIVSIDPKTKQEISAKTVHQYNSVFGKWVLNEEVTTKGFILYD